MAALNDLNAVENAGLEIRTALERVRAVGGNKHSVVFGAKGREKLLVVPFPDQVSADPSGRQ